MSLTNLLLLLLLLLQGLLAPEARARTGGYVLPPVTPEKMRELLAPGPDKLPGGYRFAGARIEKVAILARYRSPSGETEITVLLGNPSQTMGEPLKTRKFALLLHGRQSKEAAAGPGLVKALATHVRTKEGSWRWIRVTYLPAEVRAFQNLIARVMPSYSHKLYGLFLLLLLLFGPLMSWWYQRRQDGPAPPEAAASSRAAGWAKGFAKSFAKSTAFLPLLDSISSRFCGVNGAGWPFCDGGVAKMAMGGMSRRIGAWSQAVR